ncbi:MAG: 1,4-dihydroxy-2-naphthoate polyprenyltransferase [Bacilli bacterium]
MRVHYIRIGWRLLRPPTLTASITPVLVGTGLAIQQHALRVPVFLAMLVASMLIQAAANMLNEYYDFRRGLDNADMVGIAGTIVRDNVSPRTVLIITLSTLAASLLLGVYISAASSWWVAAAGIGSMLFMYLYSSGPFPISYTPLGEITAGVIMGPVIILITYFTQTHTLSWIAAIASLPIGVLIGAILLANNIRDIDHDRAGGRRTLPIVAGRSRAIQILGAAFAAAFVCVPVLMLTQRLPAWTLLSLLAAPLAARVPMLFTTARTSAQLQAAFKATSQTLIGFGFLLFIGLLLAKA